MALKGHTKIELTNINTGEVEVHESDNMVTNALNSLVNDNWFNYMVQNTRASSESTTNTLETNDTIYPYKRGYTENVINGALGGILLYSNPIEENINKLYEDYDNLVGCASSNEISTTNSKRGIANVKERKILENGYQYVWDFGTDRANGTISSICLTDRIGGKDPGYFPLYRMSYEFRLGKVDMQYRSIIKCNLDTGILEVANRGSVSDSAKISSVIIETYSFNPKNFPITNTYWYIDAKLIKSVTIPLSTTLYASTIVVGTDDNNYYIYGNSNYYNSTLAINSNYANYFYLYTVDKKDLLSSVENIKMQDSSGTSSDYINTIYKYNPLVYKNKLVIPQNYYVVTIDLDTYEIHRYRTYTSFPYLFQLKDNLIIQYDKTFEIKDDGEIYNVKTISNSNCHVGTLSYPRMATMSSSNSVIDVVLYQSSNYMHCAIFVETGYLATINNLETPIVKTSDQTMKITYTITES